MAVKLPAMQFYPGDWMKDPAVGRCSPATRGIWMDMLCAMHENGRTGVLKGTAEQLSRVCRCTAEELIAAVSELKETGAASVTAAEISQSGGMYTIINRRMEREAKERVSARGRQQRFRENGGGGAETKIWFWICGRPGRSKERHGRIYTTLQQHRDEQYLD